MLDSATRMAKQLGKQVATRIDDDLAARLAQVCEREDRSESAILRRALREYLASQNEQAAA